MLGYALVTPFFEEIFIREDLSDAEPVFTFCMGFYYGDHICMGLYCEE